jgi:lysophospholipid acyltransferase (LPLAT)-like uncharacterized protein/uncharacterized protein with HEPN domain
VRFIKSDLTLREQPRYRIKRKWPLHKKIRIWLYHTVIPPLVYLFVGALTATYRWRQLVPKELLELMSSGKPFAVATWHSDMLLAQSLGKRIGWTGRIAIMVSLSQAGEVESRILDLLDYHVVRGSARKRGKEALDDMKDILNQGAIAAMVVDGPSGPAREVKAGVVELARYCRVPVVPVAFLPGNEWILPTWDRTRIPKPFSRCIAVNSRQINVSPETENDQFEKVMTDIRDVMIDLEDMKIGWDQALSVKVRLPAMFRIKDYISEIEGAIGGLGEKEFLKRSRPYKKVVDALIRIEDELGFVYTRHFSKVYPEIEWEQIPRIRRAVSRVNRRADLRQDVWNLLQRDVPDLKRIVDAVIEGQPAHHPVRRGPLFRSWSYRGDR